MTLDASLRPPLACTHLHIRMHMHMCIGEHAYPLGSNTIRRYRKCEKYKKNGNWNTHWYEDLF